MKRHFQWSLLTLVMVLLAGVTLFPTAEASRGGGGVLPQKANGPQEKREVKKAAREKPVDSSESEPVTDRDMIIVASPSGQTSKSAAAPQGDVCFSINCPANITQGNDPDQCGAVVTYPSPTPNGLCGTINCSPASGSFFPVGTTTVNCSSTAGPTCSFTVTVNDTQAPTLTCPADITVPAAAGFEGATVEYQTPTASDNCSPAPSVNCSPASGSFFALGVTQVNCIAGSSSCVPRTITHSSSQAITPGNSGRCQDMSGVQFDNHYWRAFNLPTFSINGTFHVQSVDIGIEQASSSSGARPAGAKTSQKSASPKGVGGQQISVLLHNNTGGAFPGGTLNFLNSVSLNISDQSGTIINIPVNADLPSGSELVVEVFSGDGHGIGTSFLIGSNSAAETNPSYISAPDCGIPDPVTTSAFGFPNMHIVMNVNGCEDVASKGSASCNFNVTVKPPRYWSTIGSGGTADEDSVANVSYDDFGVRLKDGLTGTATVRYNITANYGISAFCPATQSVVYTRFRNSDNSGAHARVKFEVHRTNILSGGNDIIYTFTSDGLGSGSAFTSAVQSPAIDFDFSNYIYWVEATVFRDQASQFADLGSIEIFESEGTPCP